jgi:hypothetical protein
VNRGEASFRQGIPREALIEMARNTAA